MAINTHVDKFAMKGYRIDCTRWTRDLTYTRARIIREAALSVRPVVGAGSPGVLADVAAACVEAALCISSQWLTRNVSSTLHLARHPYRSQHAERLGVAVARLFATSKLGVSRLYRVTDLQSLTVPPVVVTANPTVPLSGRSPDFVGRDRQMGWHIIEAKGSATARPNRYVAGALKQASSAWIESPPGSTAAPPATASASVAYFHPENIPAQAVMRDPPSETPPAYTIAIDENRAVESYYSLFQVLMNAESTQQLVELPGPDVQFVMYALPDDVGVIGLHRRLHDAIAERRLVDEVRSFDSYWQEVWEGVAIQGGAVGADGIVVAGRPFIELNDVVVDAFSRGPSESHQ